MVQNRLLGLLLLALIGCSSNSSLSVDNKGSEKLKSLIGIWDEDQNPIQPVDKAIFSWGKGNYGYSSVAIDQKDARFVFWDFTLGDASITISDVNWDGENVGFSGVLDRDTSKTKYHFLIKVIDSNTIQVWAENFFETKKIFHRTFEPIRK